MRGLPSSTRGRQPRDENGTTADGAITRQLLVSYLLFISVAGILVLGFATPAFRVSHVTVLGRNLPVSQIANASGVEGRNVFTIRAANIVRDIRRVPSVLVTGVDVSIPATVTIHAVLRQPVLAWQTRHHDFLVDQYGRIIDEVGNSALLTVRDTTIDKVSLGAYVSENDVMVVRYALRMLPNAGIERVTLEDRRGLVLRSSHGWQAVLGRPTIHNLAKRVLTLKALLSLHRKKRLSFVNLTLQPPRVSWV